MAPEVLAQVLRPLQPIFKASGHPNLLVGLGVADDAAIYQLNDKQAIINTLDFFTPVVDDPYTYGAIAAANAMSDVYAMGGEVLFALNIGAFPASLEPAIITEILRGGAEKVIEAGAVIAGGHTVSDDEPKYGLAVTGMIHPQRYFTKGGAKAGDVLVLTKALGTGTISTALKRNIAAADHVEGMIESMMGLNRTAAQIGQKIGGIKAVTDITGFGLLGHALEMAQASQQKFVFMMKQIPCLAGVTTYAADFVFPGGASNNKNHFGKEVSFAPTLTEEQHMILWDPQTSGGLLLAVPADRLADFQQACAEQKQTAWVVGQVEAGNGIEVLP